MIKRILVIGSPGAGKTTLSEKLSRQLSLPVIHLDALHWRDGWQEAADDEFDRLLAEAMAVPGWIMDGNYARTLPLRLQHCDCVLYLDYPRHLCILGALKRVFKNYGRSRPDMGGNCPERLDMEFLSYIWKFPGKQRPEIMALLQDTAVPVYTLHSRGEAYRFCSEL